MADEIESREAVIEDVAEPIVDDAGVDEPSTSESEVSTPEPASGLNEALLGRAQGYGLSADDLTGLDDARVERLFGAMDRRIMQPGGGTQATGYGEQYPGARSPEPGAPMPGQYEALKIEYGDELDESVRAPVQSVVEHLNGQLKQMHAFRQEVQQELQAMNVLREFSGFDRFIHGLGEEWVAEYGTGPTMEMDPQSKEFQTRMQVFNGGRSLESDAMRMRQRISKKDSQMRSHHGVHWDRIAEKEAAKLNGKIAQRRKGFSEPPVRGKTPAMSPRDEAIAAWNK